MNSPAIDVFSPQRRELTESFDFLPALVGITQVNICLSKQIVEMSNIDDLLDVINRLQQAEAIASLDQQLWEVKRSYDRYEWNCRSLNGKLFAHGTLHIFDFEEAGCRYIDHLVIYVSHGKCMSEEEFWE